MNAFGYTLTVRILLLVCPAAAMTGAELTADEVMAKSRTAHAELGRVSLQVWTRSFEWHESGHSTIKSSVSKIVRVDSRLTALVGIGREASIRADNAQLGGERVSWRRSFRIEPGPRFLRGEWDAGKNKMVDRPVVVETYRKEIRSPLSEAFMMGYPFDAELFGPGLNYSLSRNARGGPLRLAGRENIAGHECIRLDGEEVTLWFDAKSLLLRRMIHQLMTPGQKYGRVIDVYCDVRLLAADEVPDLAPVLDASFETKSMQWVPFIPLEQLRENIRLTGRAAGLLIAPPEDQPQAQPSLPPLTPEQRAAIVTIEGDVLSGLGFYARHRGNDYLITDVRFVTQNKWVKVRDHAGNAVSFNGVFQANGARVALLRAASVPNRLTPEDTRNNKGLSLYLLCAFDKANAVMQPAFCVSRTQAAGSYPIVHELSAYMSGGPIINVDDGSVAGVLLKSDPPTGTSIQPRTPQWHAEPLFAHTKWNAIGSVPQK